MRNNNYKILLVDDESDILEFLGYNLRKEEFQVFEANNGKEAIELSKKVNPHLILLDIMMPVMDGLETCREIRKEAMHCDSANKPVIIFLSAKNEEYLQSAAVFAKADDYLSKPIKPQILISRIEEILNKTSINNSVDNPDVIQTDNLLFNKLTYIVSKNNQKFLLTKKQFEILLLLASSPNKSFKKDEIFEKVWDEDMCCNRIIIDEIIRKIIDKTGIENIKSINGDSYIFEI